jgi:hypothetical protein
MLNCRFSKHFLKGSERSGEGLLKAARRVSGSESITGLAGLAGRERLVDCGGAAVAVLLHASRLRRDKVTGSWWRVDADGDIGVPDWDFGWWIHSEFKVAHSKFRSLRAAFGGEAVFL